MIVRRISGSARHAGHLLALALVLLLGACATTTLREAVPLSLVNAAAVSGLPEVRFWGDEKSEGLDHSLTTRIDQAIASGRTAKVKPGSEIEVSYLALSGGGGDGAFGAGLLNGWTLSGTRPQFEIVTGVSTGALIAPFAFLGPKYDETLKQLYTTMSTKEVATPQIFTALLGGNAFADNSRLRAEIARTITPAMIAEIAAEYNVGRRLFVATTNLDAQRQVIWDMGAIAKSGTAESVELFRDVLLASASIPGVFSPVRITVRAGGREFQELHVDGGTTGQVFFLPIQAVLEDYTRGKIKAKVRRHLYVLRNTKVAPEWKAVDDKAFSIVERSLSTLTKSQGVGDLYRLYVEAAAQKMDFKYAALPAEFRMESKEPFDPEYMQALFLVGFETGKSSYPWVDVPPGMDAKREPEVKAKLEPSAASAAAATSARTAN